MARIARIVTYVVCPHDKSAISDEVEQLIDNSDMYVASIKSDEKDFEWSDDLIVNDTNATEMDVAKFFRELPDV